MCSIRHFRPLFWLKLVVASCFFSKNHRIPAQPNSWENLAVLRLRKCYTRTFQPLPTLLKIVDKMCSIRHLSPLFWLKLVVASCFFSKNHRIQAKIGKVSYRYHTQVQPNSWGNLTVSHLKKNCYFIIPTIFFLLLLKNDIEKFPVIYYIQAQPKRWENLTVLRLKKLCYIIHLNYLDSCPDETQYSHLSTKARW